MPKSAHRARTLLLVGTAWVAAGIAFGVPSKPAPEGTIKDRAKFIPCRNHQALKGKAVGILVGNPQPILSTEGRSGPPDSFCFSTALASYRWVYVPAEGTSIITNLQVPTGEKGKGKVYPRLNMANPKTVKAWGIKNSYTLVEVEINDGLGSPAGDSFVATGMKVLEGTKEYPLKVADAVAEVRKQYAAHVKKQARAIDKAMTEAQKKALKDQKPTGPREKAELMFVTWLPDSHQLRVHFRTRVSDGAYKFIKRGGPGRGPFPLPPPPQAAGGKQPPPPPPREITIKTGTTFGVEFGMAYEISKAGKIEKRLRLPFQSFQQKLNMPVSGPGRGPAVPPPKK
jgi:hypothetical protein